MSDDSEDDIPRPSKRRPKRAISDSSSDDSDECYSRPAQHTRKKNLHSKHLESSSDEETTYYKNAYCPVKRPIVLEKSLSILKPVYPKTYEIDSQKTLSVISKIRKKSKKEKFRNTLYLRITIRLSLELPGNQQYRKNVLLPGTLHVNPNMCYVIKDTGKDSKSKARDLLKGSNVDIYGLREYKKLTKGALKRRKFVQNYDLVFAEPSISTLMRTNFGTEAYRSKKIPFNLKLNSNILQKIENFKKTTQVIIGDNKSNKKDDVSIDVVFGKMEMTDDQLIENLQQLINRLDSVIPYGFKNVSKLQLRSLNTKPYHIYDFTIDEEEVFEEKCEILEQRSLDYDKHKAKILDAKKERIRKRMKRKLPKRFNVCDKLMAKKRKILCSG